MSEPAGWLLAEPSETEKGRTVNYLWMSQEGKVFKAQPVSLKHVGFDCSSL
jgi:hypothetical protein